MGKAWFDQYPVAAQTFAAADRELGFELSELCFNGPEQKLNRTDFAQLAIFVTSVACYQALVEADRIEQVDLLAGLSLGELTALHLAGAFSFNDGLRLVQVRGQAMQQAAEATASGMVAVSGAIEQAKIDELCAAAAGDEPGSVLVPANYNSPMQVVLSGTTDACQRAVDAAEQYGYKATPLAVAGAFHSPLMAPAAERFGEALEQVQWSAPRTPVISNVTAEPHDAQDVSSIKQRLVDQLTSPVLWSQSMQRAMQEQPQRVVELAPGKVLSGLMRRIDRSVKVENFDQPAG